MVATVSSIRQPRGRVRPQKRFSRFRPRLPSSVLDLRHSKSCFGAKVPGSFSNALQSRLVHKPIHTSDKSLGDAMATEITFCSSLKFNLINSLYFARANQANSRTASWSIEEPRFVNSVLMITAKTRGRNKSPKRNAHSESRRHANN
jgi:hypothetical protein